MQQRFSTRFFLALGVIGPLLFTVVVLIEGATRPDYSPWLLAVSQLSLGPQGWVNTVTIFVFGLFLVGFALGLKRALRAGQSSVWGPRLTLLCGLLMIVLAIFPVNSGLGYPPGVPPSYSLHGLIHLSAATIFFGCLSALCFVVGRRFVSAAHWAGWVVYSQLTGVVVVVFYILASVVTTLDTRGILHNAPGGLLQRIAIFGGVSWIACLAVRLLRRRSRS
jgi:hypothetical protein